MSNQSEARELQGYDPKPIIPICKNCHHFGHEMQTYTRRGIEWKKRRKLRCKVGEFAVKPTANCNRFEPER